MEDLIAVAEFAMLDKVAADEREFVAVNARVAQG
jgi:hypothetical protein